MYDVIREHLRAMCAPGYVWQNNSIINGPDRGIPYPDSTTVIG